MVDSFDKSKDENKLRNFKLHACDLDDACMVELAKIIPFIEEVDLGANNFTSAGCKALRDALKNSPVEVRPKAISLRRCKGITNEDIKMFRDAFPNIGFDN